uniref:Uncharacterized protein n=1 Tax=Sphaerodactylus townsendi TaxID=933632 RepID=A0ACB8FWX4_9SAUR
MVVSPVMVPHNGPPPSYLLKYLYSIFPSYRTFGSRWLHEGPRCRTAPVQMPINAVLEASNQGWSLIPAWAGVIPSTQFHRLPLQTNLQKLHNLVNIPQTAKC